MTSYNNFYEFAPGAGDGPKNNSKNFKPRPWKIKIDGIVNKPGEYDIDDFIKPYTLEERVYRMRCVEAWSFVIPWVGIPMADVIKRRGADGESEVRRDDHAGRRGRFPMQRTDVLQWPYIEGLRLDEAQNPLTLLAVGIYGEVLPAQNGAPIRLVVPWKYGFKGIKSINRIRFVENQPRNTWQIMAPQEYGFYANVNPTVDHPRWSQARETPAAELRPQPQDGDVQRIHRAGRVYVQGHGSAQKLLKPITVVKVLLLRRGAHPRRGARQGPLRSDLSWATSTLSPPTRATTSRTRPGPGRLRSSRSRSL